MLEGKGSHERPTLPTEYPLLPRYPNAGKDTDCLENVLFFQLFQSISSVVYIVYPLLLGLDSTCSKGAAAL